MKRREFLTAAAGVAGTIIPALGRGQAKPCPPPTVGVQGGTTVATSCAASGEGDWLYRTRSGPNASGVVWYHDFRSVAEVNPFRFVPGYGWDTTLSSEDGQCVTYDAGDGITGGSVRFFLPANVDRRAQWWRPFFPMSGAQNGRGTNDPAANGTIGLGSWSPLKSTPVTWNGVWGHADYPSAERIGGEFYLQIRVKREGMNDDNQEKLWYIDFNGGASQEIVTGHQGTSMFMMYRSFGATLYVPSDGTGDRQPGSEYGLCQYGDMRNGDTNACWAYPDDEWFTLLYHIIPGHQGQADTGIQVWAHKAGQSGYTKIWDYRTYNFPSFEGRNGWNHFKFAPLLGRAPTNNYGAKLSQIIFSKSFIPCPADGLG